MSTYTHGDRPKGMGARQPRRPTYLAGIESGVGTGLIGSPPTRVPDPGRGRRGHGKVANSISETVTRSHGVQDRPQEGTSPAAGVTLAWLDRRGTSQFLLGVLTGVVVRVVPLSYSHQVSWIEVPVVHGNVSDEATRRVRCCRAHDLTSLSISIGDRMSKPWSTLHCSCGRPGRPLRRIPRVPSSVQETSSLQAARQGGRLTKPAWWGEEQRSRDRFPPPPGRPARTPTAHRTPLHHHASGSESCRATERRGRARGRSHVSAA